MRQSRRPPLGPSLTLARTAWGCPKMYDSSGSDQRTNSFAKTEEKIEATRASLPDAGQDFRLRSDYAGSLRFGWPRKTISQGAWMKKAERHSTRAIRLADWWRIAVGSKKFSESSPYFVVRRVPFARPREAYTNHPPPLPRFVYVPWSAPENSGV